MKLQIGDTAKKFGVSVRTLRYYDEIGLVKPSLISESGYRYYENNDLLLLQEVLFYRELEIPLKEIENIIKSSQNERTQILFKHKELLIMKKERINELINIIDETIGEDHMSKLKITIEDIEKQKLKYADEVKERWGNTKEYIESEEKYNSSSKNDKINAINEMSNIFSEFSDMLDKSPDCAEAKNLVKKLQSHITDNYYNCTNEILLCLGQMYVADERFKNNIDKNGNGTAEFVNEAISAYCK